MLQAVIVFSVLTGVTTPACPNEIQPTVIFLAPNGQVVEWPIVKPACNKHEDDLEEI